MLRSRLRLGLTLSVFLACASTTAHAEDNGLRLGDRLVLHLGLATGFAYDSNVFFTSTNPTGAFLFQLLPSIDLATRGTQVPHAIDFRLHAGVDYNEFLTSDSNISQHRTVGVQAGGLLTILPLHKFSTDVFDNYVRMSQPPYAPGGAAPPYNFDRDTNEVGVRFNLRPGGGRLVFQLMYAFGLDFWEEAQLQSLNVLYHRISLRGSWKFLPKTAVYIQVDEQPYVYVNSGPDIHPNSYPVRAVAGLDGLLTAKLSFNLWIGYGNGLYSYAPTPPTTTPNTPNPNTPIGGIDLKWKPFVLSTAGIGYRHDFVNSLIGSYYDVDLAYVSWAQQIYRLTGTIALTYQNDRYQGLTPTNGVLVNGMPSMSRTDNLVTFNLSLAYALKNWLSLSAGYILQYNNSNGALANAGVPTALVVPFDYLKHEVYLRLVLLY